MPANPVIEGDYQNGPNMNGPGYGQNQRGDSHLIVWDEDNNIAYEFYEASRPNDPETFNGTATGGNWHAAQETVWNMNTNSFRTLGDTSADAAGLSILALLARPDEGLPVSQGGQGAIDHALRFTLPGGDVNPQYVYPASHQVDESQSGTSLPFGARLRLENTPAVNALIIAMGPEAQIIAHAMQQYGLVLADIGSAMYVTGASASENASNQISLTWNMNDVLGLHALTAGDFQVVNLTPQVTGLSAGSGSAGNTVNITGQNFSGAAGHLSVFFGKTPASSVTFVDDSHITAVVPNGTGTVNVTVQSGVSEVDNYSDNPNANVNAPIFGYGTSPITSADQFTYAATVKPPVLPAITPNPDVITYGQTATINLNASDPNGFPLTLTASLLDPLNAIRQKYGLTYIDGYFNLRDANEKYLMSSNGSNAANGGYYLLMPTGNLYAWTGALAATLAANPVAATAPSVWYNPLLLTNNTGTPIVTSGTNPLYDLSVQFGLTQSAFGFNFHGDNEWYFLSNNGSNAVNGGYYVLKANDMLYAWGGSLAASMLVADLTPDGNVYANPTLLSSRHVAHRRWNHRDDLERPTDANAQERLRPRRLGHGHRQ